MTFSYRTDETEIMDQNDITLDQMEEAYCDINRTNKLLNGYRITTKALTGMLQEAQGEVSVLDIGCGDGGMLRHLAIQLRKKGVEARFYGLDLSESAIMLAKKHSGDFPEISYVTGDIMDEDISLPTCTFVICTLTLHHIPGHKIVTFVEQCLYYTGMAMVINDLHRHKAAYYLFKLFSTIFIRSPIARNDGLVSVKRGFLKKELGQYSSEFPGWKQRISWKWAFRYVWVLKNKRLIQA